MFVSDGDDKVKVTNPAASKPPVQLTNDKTQRKPTKKFTGSRNDVFRFTSQESQPKPVNDAAFNLSPKNNPTVLQESCKKAESTAVIANSNVKLKYVDICYYHYLL